MKKFLLKLFSIILFIACICINTVYADVSDIYVLGDNKLIDAGSYIAGWIFYAAIIICVIVLMIKGIKFITASPEGKADVKKELIPWFIGIILLFSFRIALQWVANITQDNINSITYEQITTEQK